MKRMVYSSERKCETLDEGTIDGFDYIILNLGTHPTAYVRIPEDHKYFQKGYDDVDVDVHGGLTYSGKKVSNTENEGWWIGWDYAHYGDYAGYYAVMSDERKYTTRDILHDVKSVIKQLMEPTNE